MSPKFCRRTSLGPGVALLIFSATSLFAANVVPNAPTVSPAPVVDKPLAPAANDTPTDRPSAQHVWVAGHWRWSEGAYTWESGRWEIPPGANLVWHAPEWRQQANGYVLREGFWSEASKAHAVSSVVPVVTPVPAPRQVVVTTPPPAPPVMTSPAQVVSAPVTQVVTAPQPQPVIVVAPPPAVRREVVYVRPSPRHVWVPGYWAWHHGRYVWIAGHYTLPPRGRSAWVEPRWERRGGNYIFFEGHWR